MEEFKWDIIGLAETRREGEGLEEVEGGAWLYNYGATEPNKKARGVGFLIHQNIKDYISEVKSYSNRVISLQIQLTGKEEMYIIQVYAPTTDHDDEEVEQFYEDITRAVDEHKSNYTIIMGDFNAKVGKQQQKQENNLGKFGIGIKNNGVETKLDFAVQHRLIIKSSHIKSKLTCYKQ